MLVFIDDSGDPGFKFDQGSSTHFVLALVRFDDEAEAERTAARIHALRRRLRFSDAVEFKFQRSSRTVREQFLRTVAPRDFEVHSVVVNKMFPHDPGVRAHQDQFGQFVMQAVLDRFHEALTGTKVRIDGIGQRSFRRQFVRDVRQRVAVHSWKFEKSHANVLIQLADMVAGAIRRYYDESKTDRQVYRGIIANRIVDEWRL